jgi:hypothetical protein
MTGPMNPTAGERGVWSAYLSGALAELARPVHWPLVLGLPVIVRGLWATAWAESFMRSSAVGDGGASVGVAQFQTTTWKRLGLPEVEDGRDARTSPELSGRASVRYVSEAVRSGWALRLLRLRGWRVLWTRGPGATWTATVGQDLVKPDTIGARAWASPPAAVWLSWMPLVAAALVIMRALRAARSRMRR